MATFQPAVWKGNEHFKMQDFFLTGQRFLRLRSFLAERIVTKSAVKGLYSTVRRFSSSDSLEVNVTVRQQIQVDLLCCSLNG